MRLHFISIDLQSISWSRCHDLNSYDGNSTAAPLKRSLCGRKLPNDMTSTGNTVFIYFRPDDESAHFRIKYLETEGKAAQRNEYGVNAIAVTVNTI